MYICIYLTVIRWKKVLQPGLNKGHWTAEEDADVRQKVEESIRLGTVRKALSTVTVYPIYLYSDRYYRVFWHTALTAVVLCIYYIQMVLRFSLLAHSVG